MDTKKYIESYDELIININHLVKQGKLTESEIIKLIDLIDIKILLENNKLSKQFMENILRQKLENDFEDLGMEKINITYGQACKMQDDIR